MTNWGLLPEQVKTLIMQREWHNSTNLRARLIGDRAFPIRIGLKPPTGNQALADLQHFQSFQNQWQNFSQPDFIQWQEKQYRQIGKQSIPEVLQLDNMQALLNYLGPEAIARSQLWQARMHPVLQLNDDFYPILIRHISTLENLSAEDSQLLAQLLPQLHAGMGQDNYLRALPLQGVDSKFVESYQPLLTDLLDQQHQGAVLDAGGLLAWLDCCDNPKGWLMVRALDAQSRNKLSNLPLLQLSTEVLLDYPLPASNILIVENQQSGLALPELADTIAVFAGGRNTGWMDAAWLTNRRIGYWGDIDSWGLAILSEARARQPALQSLMMDEKTLLAHQSRMADEGKSVVQLPEYLNLAEQQLFSRLCQGYYGKPRLEQERLSPDYVTRQLQHWCAGLNKQR